MKKNLKIVFGIWLGIISIFIVNMKIKADFPASISATYSGTISPPGISSKIMNKQFDNTGRAFCTRFWYAAPYGKCNATTWSSDATENERISVAVGAMINKARSLSNSGGSISSNNYYFGEMAINYFLYNYNGKKYANNVTLVSSWGIISSNASYKAIYAAGVAAYNNYGKTSVQFTNQNVKLLDDGRTVKASATLRCIDSKGNSVGCSARVRDTLKLTGKYQGTNDSTQHDLNETLSATYNRVNSPDIHYDYSYTYTLPEGYVFVPNTEIRAEFFTKNKVIYYSAKNYNCGGSYQSLTPNMLIELDKYDETQKISTVRRNAPKNECTLVVNKKDENGNGLKGAKFELYSDQGLQNKIDSGDSSSSGQLTFSGLSSGVLYYLKETKAPSGYIGDSSVKTVNFTADGSGNCTETKTINVTNTVESGRLKILKVDESGNAVIGAKIKVFRIVKNGESIDNTEGQSEMSDYNFIDNSEYSFDYITAPDGNDYFITTANPIEISGLTVGETYYVYEESVPENSDYSVKIGSAIAEINDTNEVVVTLENVHSHFKISKQDITSKKELPGAILQIYDSRGIMIYEWTSTNVQKEILGLEDGEYTLVEITAPKGYQQAESIKFTIENGKLKDDSDNVLVMYDDTEKVHVPDTLSSRNILIVLSGMAIVAAGIAVFLYGVKKKDEI